MLTLCDQVVSQIDHRLSALARGAYDHANKLPDGKYRKRRRAYSLPAEAAALLQLKIDALHAEDDADALESIAATVTTGAFDTARTTR